MNQLYTTLFQLNRIPNHSNTLGPWHIKRVRFFSYTAENQTWSFVVVLWQVTDVTTQFNYWDF